MTLQRRAMARTRGVTHAAMRKAQTNAIRDVVMMSPETVSMSRAGAAGAGESGHARVSLVLMSAR